VDSGVNDTRIYGPYLDLSDAGTRTLWNNVGTNAGDPGSAGVWNGQSKFPGLVLLDTTNNLTYLYTGTSTKSLLANGYPLISTSTSGTPAGQLLFGPSSPTGGYGPNQVTSTSSFTWDSTNGIIETGGSSGAATFTGNGGSNDTVHIKSGATARYATLDFWNNAGTPVREGAFGWDNTNTNIFFYVAGNPFSVVGSANGFATMLKADGATDYVGLNTLGAATSNTLCYNTTLLTGFDVFSTCSSLRKYKTDIQAFVGANGRSPLQEVQGLQPVSYTSKTDGRREAGFIAEDVEKLDPRFATYDRDGKLEGVDYGHMIALLTIALQEQQAEIESLMAQVAALTKQNAQ